MRTSPRKQLCPTHVKTAPSAPEQRRCVACCFHARCLARARTAALLSLPDGHLLHVWSRRHACLQRGEGTGRADMRGHATHRGCSRVPVLFLPQLGDAPELGVAPPRERCGRSRNPRVHARRTGVCAKGGGAAGLPQPLTLAGFVSLAPLPQFHRDALQLVVP